MKGIIGLLLFGTMMWGQTMAQYTIKLTVKQMAGKKVSLACHYEEQLMVQDTVVLDNNGVGYFRHASKKLASGIYMLYFSPSSNWDILIGSDQSFSISCDTSLILNTMRIEGSPENQAFLEFQKFMVEMGRQNSTIREEFRKDPDNKKAEVREKYSARYAVLDKEVRSYIGTILKRFPGTALATFARFTLPVEIPDFSKEVPEGTKDRDMEIRRKSFFYMQEHYWDNANLTDSMLIRTDIFKKQLDNYFSNFVINYPDSLYRACVRLVEKARPNKLMFRYLTDYCLNSTFENKIMGMDEAFVKFGQRYYVDVTPEWVTPERLKTIREEVIKRQFNLLNHPAVELKLSMLEGEWVSLHEVKAPFVLLLFWEPNCGHCKTQVPLVRKEIYERFAPYGLKGFAVNTHTDKKQWEEFVEKNDLFDFINCWDPNNQSNYRTYYNVFSTPVMYILDKDKKFIAKSLTVDQMVDLLKHEYKKMGIEVQ